MRISALLSQAWREARGSWGRLGFFVICLSAGVAAVVAVAGFSNGLQQTLRDEARPFLAADLVVKGRVPLPEDLDRRLAGLPGVRLSRVQELVSVVAAPPRRGAPGESLLAELKVIGGEYPFYGELRLDPAKPLRELLAPDTVVVAPEILDRLGLSAGDDLLVGGTRFRIAGTVLAEPDRVGFSLSAGPRVLLGEAGLAQSQLSGRGARVNYRMLVKLPAEASAEEVEKTAARLRAGLSSAGLFEVETYQQAQPALREALGRAEKFLRLAALLSLVIGGVGVAQAVRAWIALRLDSMAVLRCLGMRPREVFFLSLLQTLGLGLAGSLAGGLTGVAALGFVAAALGGLLPAWPVRLWQPAAFLEGLLLGVGVALVFSLPPLLAVLRVPPVRVLRREAEPLPQGLWGRLLGPPAVLGGIFLIAAQQTRSLALAGGFVLALALTGLALAGAARGLGRLAFSVPRRAPVWVRHGLQALGRPGAGTLGATTALGLGALVVIAMTLVERSLVSQLAAALPARTPTAYLIDVQTDQWGDLQQILKDRGAESWNAAPLVTGRLTAVEGRPAAEVLGEGEHGRRRWVFTREQRLSFARELPADNRLLDGAWRADPADPGLSVEEGFARDLGVKVGSRLTFDIQGVPLEFKVNSLRSVEWRSFAINFFLLAEPGLLEPAPHSLVVNARLPSAEESRIRDEVTARFPNIVMIPVREILDKLARILGRVGEGVRFVGFFTVAAGVAILAGAVGAGNIRRGREVALFKALGMTRAGVVAVYGLEYALQGAVAGIIGTAGGVFLAWGALEFGLDLRLTWQPLVLAAGLAGVPVLAVISGLAASLPALRRPPLQTLQAE